MIVGTEKSVFGKQMGPLIVAQGARLGWKGGRPCVRLEPGKKVGKEPEDHKRSFHVYLVSQEKQRAQYLLTLK